MKAAFARRAEFIWRPRNLQAVSFAAAPARLPEEAQRFVYFRLAFDLAAAPTQALVHATADGRYELFANGQRVARGPARSASAHRQLDPVDLAPHLRPGRNVLAVLAHAYGRNNAWYELPGWDHSRAFGCGGFFLQGDAQDLQGHVVRLDTDARWRCLEAQAWQRGVPCNSLGTSEIFDARRVPDWTGPALDDSEWLAAEVLCVPGRAYTGDVRPFQHLALRDIPAQREAAAIPARAIAWWEVASGPLQPDVAGQMASEAPLPLQAARFDPASGRVQAPADRGLVLVYDFGEVLAGYIGLELDAPAGAVLDFYPGEQRWPDGRVRIFDGIPGYDAQIGHRYVAKAGPQRWERFEWNGLRYLQICVRHCDAALHLQAVQLTPTGYPLEPRGHFECADVLLNRIWQTGATTLARCMHDAYVDCPSREQRQWMDAYLDARINHVCFGDTALAARLIRQMADSQRPEGLTMMAAPGDFALAAFTNIPDFCLYWVLMIGDHLRHTADDALADEIYPAVARALQWFERLLDGDDLLGEVPMWVFVDWAETDKQGQVTALNALYVAALQTAAGLAQRVGHARAARHYEALQGRVAAAIHARLWDEERGVYVDARRHGRQSRRVSQQSNAAVLAFVGAPAERAARVWPYVLDPARLVLTHALGADGKVTPFDTEHQVVKAQPFYGHFVHRALRASGRHADILHRIRRLWGGLLADGATTWRETWQLDPITSLCHAWSGTPSFDLSTDVLGVERLGPQQVRVAPVPGDLAWARGRYPLPQGDLHIAWVRGANQFELDIEVPTGASAAVHAPAGWVWRDPPCPGPVGPGQHHFVAEACPT